MSLRYKIQCHYFLVTEYLTLINNMDHIINKNYILNLKPW